MTRRRRIFEDQSYVHFVTFSCYKRRHLLAHESICKIILGNLDRQLNRFAAACHGFVLMPDHVHVLLQFQEPGQLASFLQQWKQQASFHARKAITESLPELSRALATGDPFWQPGYYDFPIESKEKYLEKLDYSHQNPVRAGLVKHAAAYRWSSARWYELRKFAGVTITPIDTLS